MSRRFDAGYFVSEGVHSIFTHGFMSFAAVCMIVACLIIMGSFSLLAVNLDNTLGDLENENEMIVYIDETLNLGQAQAMKSKLAQVDNVSQLTFVSRQQALADFKAKHGGENSVMADLPADALAGLPKLELVGSGELRVENHKGILAYGREEIHVSGGIYLIKIAGQDLELRAMTGIELLITGKISQITLA